MTNIYGIKKHIRDLKFAKEQLNHEKNALYLRGKLSKKDFRRIDTIKYHLKCINIKILDLKHTAQHIKLKRLKNI